VGGPYPPFAVSSDGRTIAVWDRGVVRLWEVKSGRERGPIQVPDRLVGAVAFSPDGRLLVVAGDGGVYVYGLADGSLLRRLRGGHEGRVTTLAFSPDGGAGLGGRRQRRVDLGRVWAVRPPAGEAAVVVPLREAGPALVVPFLANPCAEPPFSPFACVLIRPHRHTSRERLPARITFSRASGSEHFLGLGLRTACVIR
jgi:hypothetical protein